MKMYSVVVFAELTDSCVVFFRERLVKEFDRTSSMLVDLGSDQTSCHNPYHGGYCPVQVSIASEQFVSRPNCTAM